MQKYMLYQLFYGAHNKRNLKNHLKAYKKEQ